MFKLEYLKNGFSENEYNDFVNNVNENFPKYKKAIYNYYDNNNDKFPFDDYDFFDDVLLVIFLNEYDYSKELVLRVLDNMLTNISNNVHKVLVLNFLYGFGIVNREEMDKRNPYIDLIEK